MSGKFTDCVFRLSKQEPIATGNERAVYESENFPELLLKVPLPTAQRKLSLIERFLFKRYPLMQVRGLKAEYLQYITTIYSQDADLDDLPIPMMYGFVQTDVGPASVVEKISLFENRLAPSIHKMIQDQLQSEIDLQALNVFAKEIVKFQIVTTDLTVKNIVYGERRGRRRFFLVDGIGDNYAFKVRHLSHYVVKYDQSKKFQKIARALGIHWCRESWSFSSL